MTQSPNNFFSDLLKQFSNPEHYMNMFKKMPNLDFNSFGSSMQKNSEALMKAGQIQSENIQAIARRYTEVLKNNAAEFAETAKEVMSSGNPELAMQRQSQYLKDASSNSLNQSKELFEMASKSMLESFDLFSKSVQECVVEAAPASSKKKN